MKEILTKINRERGFTYKVDKEGNVIKESYNLMKDPYTLVTLAILILSLLYFIQIHDMKTTESNFQESCELYMDLKTQYIQLHPDNPFPTLEEVFSITNKQDYKLKR